MLNLRWSLFVALAMLLPFDGSQLFRVSIAETRVSFTDLLVLILLFLDLQDRILARRPTRPFVTSSLAIAAAMTILSTISLLYIGGLTIRVDLKMTLNLTFLVAFLLIFDGLIRRPGDGRRATTALMASCAVMVAATFGKVGGLNLPGEIRADSLEIGPFLIGLIGLGDLGQSTASLLLLGLPLVWLAGPQRWWLRWGLVSAFVLASAMPLSRGLGVGIATELTLLILWHPGRRDQSVRRALRSVGLIGLAFALVLWGPELWDAIARFRPRTIMMRLMGLEKALEIFLQDPLLLFFGAGTSTYLIETSRVPHNMFVDVIVAKGLVTATVYVWFLLRIAQALWRKAIGPHESAQLCRTLLVAEIGMVAYGMGVSLSSTLTFFLTLALAVVLAAQPTEPVEALPLIEGTPIP